MAKTPRKLRVGVVFGGRSGEHEVSLAGAASVLAAMDKSRFEPVPIGIARDGRWLMGGDPLRALAGEAAQSALASGDPEAHTRHELLERAVAQDTGASLMRMESSEGLPAGLRDRLDVVLVLLHGPQGEDGTVQGLLQLAGVPYTGAGVLGSAVGMDKIAMKDLFRAHGLPIVEHAVVRRHDWEHEPAVIRSGIAAEIGFPCFVKPANLGSSVGISKVKTAEDLAAAIDLAARHDRRILVERAVQGREVEVAVLGNDEPRVSVVAVSLKKKEWYDYDTKYGEGQTTFKVPAPLPPEVTEEVRSLALRAFRAIDCAGMARVDFFIEGERRVLVNEINTIPGFTSTSAYPRLWEASGIPYPELISRLIDLALERR